MDSVRSKLLIASPSMPDWFARCVILMVEHTDDGAFGLVLNRPSEASVGDAVPRLAEVAGGEEMIHIGGPVQPDGVVGLGEFLWTTRLRRGSCSVTSAWSISRIRPRGSDG